MQEQDTTVAAIRQQLQTLQAEASKCKDIGGDTGKVTGGSTKLMRMLDTALASGANPALADIAQQAADTLEPLGLTQAAARFDEMRQIALGERKPFDRAL